MEAIVEALRDIALKFWKNVLLSYRMMVIRAELRRRKAIADCQDRKNTPRKAQLDQHHTACGKDTHSITIEDAYQSSAGTRCSTTCICDRSEMRLMFDLVDENKDGFISADEIQRHMKRLGFELSDQSATDMLKSVDTNNDNCVGFEQFFSLYSSLCGGRTGHSTTGDKHHNCQLNEREEDDEEGNLLEAFFVFDENKDGWISALELQQVLLKLGLPEGRSLMSCQKMIERVDADGNGKVDFFEFKDMMCSNAISSCSS